MKILSTLLKSDSGTATVDGFDVATQAANVRESISLTGQFAAVDGASAFPYPSIFLPFISSAFVLTETIPGPARRVPSPRTSRRRPPATRSATCSHNGQSAPTSGSPWPGALAFSQSRASLPWPLTAARSPEGVSQPSSRWVNSWTFLPLL